MNVDVTALVVAAINQLEPMILIGLASLGYKALSPSIQKFLGEKNAAIFQDRVNHVLNVAIGFAVQKSDGLVAEHGALTVPVKNVMVGWAAEYAMKHAPDLMEEAGDVVEKVLARFDTHPAVQGLVYAAQPTIAHAA